MLLHPACAPRVCGPSAQPRAQAGGQSAETWPWGQEHLLGEGHLGHLGHTECQGHGGGLEARGGAEPVEGCGVGYTQAAWPPLHVVKGARASGGESAQ